MDLLLKILKILWRIIRALLITVLALLIMIIGAAILPLWIIAVILAPELCSVILNKLGEVKVF